MDAADHPGGLRPPASLTREERRGLERLATRSAPWTDDVRAALGRLTAPIDDVLLLLAGGRGGALWSARWALMMAMRAERQAFWGWDHATWARILADANNHVRQHVMAVAYLLCGWRDLHQDLRAFQCRRFARHVFGPGPVDAALARVQDHLDGLGHATVLQRPHLQGALYELMLEVGSPLLSDLASCGGLLCQQRSREQHGGRRHGVEQLARTLVAMGILEALRFAATVTREEWLERRRAADDVRPNGLPGRAAGF